MDKSGVMAEYYNLKWTSHQSNLLECLYDHQSTENLVDTTLVCEGKYLSAHKIILSSCSGFFKDIFNLPTKLSGMCVAMAHPIVLISGVKYDHLKQIIEFIYKGEIKVSETDIEGVLNAGQILQVKGLCSVQVNEQFQTTPKINNNNKRTKDSPIKKRFTSNNDQGKDNSICCDAVSQISKNLPALDRVKKTDFIKKTVNEPPPKKPKATPQIIKPQKIAGPLPKPVNPFMLFADDKRKEFSAKYPNETSKEISIRLSDYWKNLSQESKQHYYNAAKIAQYAARSGDSEETGIVAKGIGDNK